MQTSTQVTSFSSTHSLLCPTLTSAYDHLTLAVHTGITTWAGSCVELLMDQKVEEHHVTLEVVLLNYVMHLDC